MKRALLALVTLAGCGDAAGPPDARPIDAAPPKGTVSMSWTISDGTSTLTCGDVQTSEVDLTLTPIDLAFGASDSFPCSDGHDTSIAVSAGTYDVTAALGTTGATATFNNVVVKPGQDTAMGNAAFTVSAVGGFRFQLLASVNGNCLAVGSGGAGIEATEIDVTDGTNTCVPMTFDISAGATQPASTYTTSCTAPAPTVCIDNDQEITVAPTVPSGTYSMVVTGIHAATACWSATIPAVVPAAGASHDLGSHNLTKAADPVCSQ